MKYNINLNLNNREKMAVYAAGVFIAIFIFVHFIIAPVFAKRNQLRDKFISKQNAIAEMEKLQDEYFSLKQKEEKSKQGFANRPPGFTLFSFLDKLAGQTGIKNQISYMKPSSVVEEGSGLKLSRVEMKLQEISMNDLVAYLYGIENSDDMLNIKRLSINKTGKGKGLLSALILVETIES